jgi:uroporphyrin-III C-methyltransferase
MSTSIPESNATYPAPQTGASLLLSFRLERKTVVVVGGNTLAAARAFAALEADARVVVIHAGGPSAVCAELRWRASQGQLHILEPDVPVNSSTPPASQSTEDDGLLTSLENVLSSKTHVQLVCVTDTMLGSPSRRSHASAAALASVCQRFGVPITVADEPALCDFSFTATHRFVDPATGEKTPLQIGVSTSGQGCRIAGRVRREIVSRLPRTVGGATAGVARLRARAKANISHVLPVHGEEATTATGQEEPRAHGALELRAEAEAEASEDFVTPNLPVVQRAADEHPAEGAKRQMRWVAQVSEYWPLAQLAQLTDADAERVLSGEFDLSATAAASPSTSVRPALTHASDTELGSLHALSLSDPPAPPPRKGRILLVGSGPGHPSLLTRATYTALTELADLVLSDKLVPTPVLALVPSRTEVRIARKFPGNAEGAQQEMMEAAVVAANQGLTVVRVRLFQRYRQPVD